MSTTKLCTIQILNKTYQIKCDEQEVNQLQLAAEQLNQHALLKKNSFKHLNDFQVLLLAALHVSHELITCQTQHTQQRQQLSQFIHSLEREINQSDEMALEKP